MAATMAAMVRSSRSAGGSTCGGRALTIWPMSLYSLTTFWQWRHPLRWRLNSTRLAEGRLPNAKSKASGCAASMSCSESIVAPSQAGELGPQGVGCGGRAGFDRADRDVETLGDLGVGEAVSDQAHHVGVDRRQFVEGLVDGHDGESLINAVVLGWQLEVLDRQERPGRGTAGDVVGRR